MKEQELTNSNTLSSHLFSLATLKPPNSDKVLYMNLGPYLGKRSFNKFIDESYNQINIKLDKIVYSRICIEITKIDDLNYIEISTDQRISLPIAGNQYKILERDANKFGISLVGFIDSLNFILNDSRIFSPY